MIRIDNQRLYSSALATLRAFTGNNYYGRLVQIFLACKHYGGQIPVVGSGTGIDIGTLQRLLDDLYEKPSLLPRPSVAIIFGNSHLPRTGIPGPGRAGPQNTWRNNFNLQKGFPCFASEQEVNDLNFRNAPRISCPHLIPTAPNTLADARCNLSPAASYRREDHAKVFRIDPASRDHSIYDPTDIAFYSPLILNRANRRIPIGPLVVALYYDSVLAAERSGIALSDFLLDFNFSNAEFHAYFDDSPDLEEHVELRRTFPRMFTWEQIPIEAGVPAPIPAPAPIPPESPEAPIGGFREPNARQRRAGAAIGTSTVAPPAGSHWWDAEQAVRQLLEADGWLVTDKTRFGVGYDLEAQKNGITKYVEVKSSAGRCSPTLTSNEYAEAKRSGAKYVLAVVENFDPKSSVEVLWIQNPAALLFTRRQTEVFSLPRSQWKPKASQTI